MFYFFATIYYDLTRESVFRTMCNWCRMEEAQMFSLRSFQVSGYTSIWPRQWFHERKSAPQVLRTPVFQGITPWLHHPLFFSSMIYIDLWVSCFRVFPRCFGESLCETLPGSNVLGFWRCLSGLGADKNCPENRWQIPNDSEPHPGGIVMHCRCMDVISIHVFSGWIGEMPTWYNMII